MYVYMYIFVQQQPHSREYKRHARSHPRTCGRGDETEERISTNYLNQSKIAYVRCHYRDENYYFPRDTPAANRFADFGKLEERPVERKREERSGTLEKSQEDKTLKVISLIVFNYLRLISRSREFFVIHDKRHIFSTILVVQL